MRFLASVILILVAAGCSAPAGSGPSNVLVVMNSNSPDSVAVAKYYAAKRQIADKYICKINCPTDEQIKDEVFEKSIREPIKQYLEENSLKDKIDYIVLTKGIPIRYVTLVSSKPVVKYTFWGVDSVLVCLFIKTEPPADTPLNNPYYGAAKHFSHKDCGMYLVTRLDGLNVADAKSLVDRSLEAKPNKGLFLIDIDPGYDTNPGYKPVNDGARGAALLLKAKGYDVELEATKDFVSRTGLMGYFSWGSLDSKYSQETFNKLQFLPGSIAEVAQSTSAYTLTSNRTLGGKRSYITDLIAQGATGARGHVYEPFAVSISDAHILFDRYVSGYNLAESFYCASRFVHWRDIVLGDPLCAPYAK